MRAQYVTVAGDRNNVRRLGDQLTRLLEIVDDGDLVEQPAQRTLQRSRAVDHIDRVGRESRKTGPRRVVDLAAAEQHSGATEIFGLELLHGGDGGVEVIDGNRISRRTECRGDRRLVATAYRQQRCNRSEQAADLVGRGEQRARAVLAGQSELEGFLAGRES